MVELADRRLSNEAPRCNCRSVGECMHGLWMTLDKDGLHNKFEVKRVDGTPIPSETQLFVLDLTEDRHARAALTAYAQSVRLENPTLARDLDIILARLKRG